MNGNGMGLPIAMAAKLWPTPIARDSKSLYAGDETMEKNSRPLTEVVGRWSTPTVADVTGGRTSRSGDRSGELLLNGQARALCSHLDPTPAMTGHNSSIAGRRLNPLFVEVLMGWPPGWTTFGCSETALSLWRRRMRSALSLLTSHAAPPAQLNLFG